MANLRDLGGLPFGNRAIQPGRLLRSAAPARFDPAARARINGLHLAAIVDLRSTAEREAAPTIWLPNAIRIEPHGDGGGHVGDPAALAAQCTISAAETRAAILRIYAAIPTAQAAALRAFFGALATARTPLLVHCAVGKDRTGAAIAILLAALGVPMQAIVEDYLASNESRPAIAAAFEQDPRTAAIRAAPAETWAPMLGAEPAYLEALFQSLGVTHGSARDYVEDAIGAGGLERIAAHLASA